MFWLFYNFDPKDILRASIVALVVIGIVYGVTYLIN